MKKNSFLEGAFFATFSIFLCKILGLLYVIPFYGLIGDKGGALYSYAYSIYSIFLSLSTVGIPLAMSRLVSEYNELGYDKTKKKLFSLSKKIILLLGVTFFVIIMVFAPQIAYLMIGNVDGGNTIAEVSMAIRVVGTALLVVPSLSVTRGYLNGHKFISVTGASEVIEQLIRVIVIVGGSFVVIKVLNLPPNIAVYISVFGATVGAFSSLLYLRGKISNNNLEDNKSDNAEPEITAKELIKKMFLYALPFVIIALVREAYGMVDSFTVIKAMDKLGYDIAVSEKVFGVLATWASKLNMIVASVALGLVTSLIPNISGSVARKDYEEVNYKINQAFQSLLFIVLPMAIGISFLAQPVWTVFYGYDQISVSIFKFYILQSIIFCVYTVSLNLAQSMGKTKIALGGLFFSFIFKVIFNSPAMYLFKFMGIEAYYAPIIVNIIAQGIATIVILIILKKQYKFNYKLIAQNLLKTMVSIIIMLVSLSLLKIFIPLDTTNRMLAIVIILIYTIWGIAIYYIVSKKTKLVDTILGDNFIEKLLK